MTQRPIIITHALASLALFAAWLAGGLFAPASVPFSTFTLVMICAGALAVLTSLGSTAALWRTRRTTAGAVGRGTAAIFLLGALSLVVSWGAGVVGWVEEFRAGTTLPIINLGFLLLPVGLVLSVVAALTACAGRPPAESGPPCPRGRTLEPWTPRNRP